MDSMNKITSYPDLSILKQRQQVLYPYTSYTFLYYTTHILVIMLDFQTALTLFQVLTDINMKKSGHLSKELCKLEMTILLCKDVSLSGVDMSHSPLRLHQYYFTEWMKRRNIHFS